MRRALNENPLVQAGLIGVLALAVGLMLLMQMGGSSESEPEAPAAEPPPTAATPADAAAATAPADPASGAPTTPAPVDPATGAVAAPGTSTPAPTTEAAEFTAGPGLPEDVADAYEQGKVVVLLIVDDDGIDDRKVRVMVEALRARPDAAVFVTDDAARYSRITEGVDVDRTPALVIVRPKSLTDGPIPTAVVSYGFRGDHSVEQAYTDALYKGPANLPYHP